MPNWMLQFLIGELSKFLTPEIVARLETSAKQFVFCELKKFAAATPTTIDDAILAVIAGALGVDPSCGS